MGSKVGPAKGNVEAEYFESRNEDLKITFQSMDLEEQLQKFIKSVTMTKAELQLRHNVMDDLRWLLRPLYPRLQLHPFGSLVSELGDKDSDLDVFLDSYGDAAEGGKSIDREQKAKIFDNIYSHLRHNQFSRWKSQPSRVQNVFKIPVARVPIIKFVHRRTNIACDLSFENILSVRNSQLIQFLTQLDPRVRPLMCLVRYWGKFHQIADSNKIKNYGLCLLVLVYLKRIGILPSIYQLQHWDPNIPEYRVDFWNVSFFTNATEILKSLDEAGRPSVIFNKLTHPTTLSIFELIRGFFKMYEKFPAETHVVCTLTGEFLQRENFTEGFESELPEELADYKRFCAEADPEIRRLKTSSNVSFIIQDPFALNFNVSACTSGSILIRFMRACTSTVKRINELIDSCKNIEKPNVNLMDIFQEVEYDDLPTKRRKIKEEKIRHLNQLELMKHQPKNSPMLVIPSGFNFQNEIRKIVDSQLSHTNSQMKKKKANVQISTNNPPTSNKVPILIDIVPVPAEKSSCTTRDTKQVSMANIKLATSTTMVLEQDSASRISSPYKGHQSKKRQRYGQNTTPNPFFPKLPVAKGRGMLRSAATFVPVGLTGDRVDSIALARETTLPTPISQLPPSNFQMF